MFINHFFAISMLGLGSLGEKRTKNEIIFFSVKNEQKRVILLFYDTSDSRCEFVPQAFLLYHGSEKGELF
jgi:hypothetical protein